MSTSSQDLLESFDRLPDVEKREVATEIIRRTFAANRRVELDDAQLAALYSEYAVEDRELAEQGMEDYAKGLLGEDAP
jgi:hypothetical protein